MYLCVKGAIMCLGSDHVFVCLGRSCICVFRE